MKMKPLPANRIIRIIITVSSLLGSLSSPLCAEQFGLFTYVVSGDSVTITDYPEDTVGEVVIPSEIEGKPVTMIDHSAFSGCRNLTSIILPRTLIELGEEAFHGCQGLTSFTIPSSLTTIGYGAFSSCSALESIAVEVDSAHFASVDGVLYNKSITSIVQYPPGRIGAYTVPASVIYLSNFLSCHGLTAINVDESHPNYSSVEGVLFNKEKTRLLRYPPGKSGDYLIPETVESIRDDHLESDWGLFWEDSGAFLDCRSLTKITVPEGVTRIGPRTFGGCSALTSVVLPESLSEISYHAFADCGSLQDLTLPSKLTKIGWHAFGDCNSLTEVSIPASVELIAVGAFGGCRSLVTIEVDPLNQVYRSLDGVLFKGNLEWLLQYPGGRSGHYVVPEGTKSIRGGFYWGSWYRTYGAFEACPGLTGVTIPPSVTGIAERAFAGCDSLQEIAFLGDAPKNLDSYVFSGTSDAFTIYYLGGSAGFTSPTWHGYPSSMIDERAYPAASWLLSKGLPHDTDLQQDFNRDGVSLLMAYALALDPNKNLSGSLPAPKLDHGTLSMTFHAASPGVSYSVETSTNLRDWKTGGVTLSDLDDLGRRTAMVPRDRSAQRFMRLVVEE